jgi:hypothetical protein
MARQQGPDPRITVIVLIAWVIDWVGDHGWSALLRLVVLVLACAAAGTILLRTVWLIRGM